MCCIALGGLVNLYWNNGTDKAIAIGQKNVMLELYADSAANPLIFLLC